MVKITRNKVVGSIGKPSLGLWFGAYLSFGSAQTPPATKDPEVEALIDQLQTAGSAGSSTAWYGQFIPIDEAASFHGGILGSPPPKIDPTMRALVRLGVRALPDLIAHLSDKRPTKETETHEEGFGAMWFSDEFDPRYGDPKLCPPGVNRLSLDNLMSRGRLVRQAQIFVGDMCFVAIGQIVNRSYMAIRYQPTACEVLNSPIENPALAAAVIKDWGGLTKKEHEAQLENDADSLVPYASAQALKRLIFYYPEDGRRTAIRLLERKPYDYAAVWDFADTHLMNTDDPAKWKYWYQVSVRKFGADASAMIPHWIHWGNWLTSTDHPPRTQARATRLLHTLFPSYSPYRNVPYRVAALDDLTELISGIQYIPDPQVDAAVQAVFRRVTGNLHPSSKAIGDDDAKWGQRDALACACASRMAGKGYDAEYLAYFKWRLPIDKAAPENTYQRGEADGVAKWVKKLSATEANPGKYGA